MKTTQTRPSSRCVQDKTISPGETWFVTQRQANDRSHHQWTTITYSLTTLNLSPHRTTFINKRSAHRLKSYLPEPPRPAIDFFIFGLAKFEFMEELELLRKFPSLALGHQAFNPHGIFLSPPLSIKYDSPINYDTINTLSQLLRSSIDLPV